MQTSKWGPPFNEALLYVAAGYDLNEAPKYQKDQQYKMFFESLGDILPCRYCRESYKVFYKALDINKYLNMPSCGLIRFVYDLRNLVNDKLIKQEEKALHEEYQKLLQTKSPDDPEFWRIIREKSHKICFTKPPPDYNELVDRLMKHRAGCSAKMKTCRDPLVTQPKYPTTPDISQMGIDLSGLDTQVYKAGGRKPRKLSRKVSTGRKVSRKRSRKRKTSIRKKR